MAHGANLRMTVVLVGLLLITASHGRLTPRISFPIDDNGSSVRVTAHFSHVENVTTLLLSDDGATLYVGARNAVFSLSANQPGVLTLKQEFAWPVPKSDADKCNITFGMSKCANYILVLQLLNATQLYVCGNYAWKPQEIIIDAETLTRKSEDVKGHCSVRSDERHGAVSVDGEMYVATISDFMRRTPIVSRFLSKNGRQNVSLNNPILQDPTFIRSTAIPGDKKVYFFFTESSNEYNFMSKLTVSRVAQVCKDDVGGKYTLQKQWTTFAKAELVCQQGEDLQFNILHDIVPLPALEGDSSDDVTFYGIFRSQWSLSSGVSAVCAFKLHDIKAAFSGNYRKRNNMDSTYTSQTDKSFQFGKCGLPNDNSRNLDLVKVTFLTEKKVKSMENRMVLLSPDQAYSRVVGQRTQAANGQIYTVLFLLSESGYLHKVVLLKSGPHIIEAIQVLKSPQTVKNIIMSTSTGMVFVGSPEGVSQVPVSNCSFYQSCAECVMARDPFCGWDPSNGVCARLSSVSNVSNLLQDVEQGNATAQCKSFSSDKSPQEKELHSELNSLIVLLCPKPSSQSLLSWRFSNHTLLPPDIYLQSGDGRLVFASSPFTVGRYICVSEERGFKQIVAIFSVKLGTEHDKIQLCKHNLFTTAGKTSPTSGQNSRHTTISGTNTHSTGSSTSTTREPEGYVINTQIQNKADNGANSLTSSKSYYGELVAVSTLLVICVLILGGMFWWHRRSPRKPL